MIFAAFVFSPLYLLLVVLVAFAILAGIGVGHALANQKRDGIRRKEVDGRLSMYFEKSNLPHIARYFRCLEHDDLIGAAHEKKRISEIAMNDKEVDRIFDRAAESWLRNRLGDPDSREKIVRDIEHLEHRDRGTMVGAIEAAEVKILRGVKETATVPTGDGSTTTVPVAVVHNHTHYHGPDAAAGAPPAPAAAGT